MRLFHYTDAGAIKSIIENEELWLTDLRFLNDEHEFSRGVALILVQLTKLDHHAYSDIDAKNSVEFVLSSFQHHVNHGVAHHPLFVCSFTRSQDLLSQWRSYGTLALEFDSDEFGEDAHVYECFYEDGDVNEKLTGVIHAALNACLKSYRQNGSLDEAAVSAYTDLIRVAAQIKHRSFFEENEHRLIVGSDAPQLEIHHRCRGSLFIPYIKKKIQGGSIKAIHVGPQSSQDLVAESIRSFLRSKSREDIEVIRSHTPYRST